jgi:hypothetical protein
MFLRCGLSYSFGRNSENSKKINSVNFKNNWKLEKNFQKVFPILFFKNLQKVFPILFF